MLTRGKVNKLISVTKFLELNNSVKLKTCICLLIGILWVFRCPGEARDTRSINMLEFCKSHAILKGVKSGRLSKRIGLFRNEIDWNKIPETYGAEPVFNGSPVGGGKGYSDIIISGDYVVRTYDELKQALAKATRGQVVFIPGDVQMDFKTKAVLTIPPGVTLASDRGHQKSPGALIYSSFKSSWMFRSAGNFVRVSGLRLRGPWDRREKIDSNARGITINHFGGEIDNCEISAFTRWGVRIGGDRSYVHNNYFHHNCMHGFGYGVSVAEGRAIIEANKFDHNRHHVASTGSPTVGYEIRYNISSGYGNFDMHEYTASGRSVENLIAGNFLNVHHNTMKTPLYVGSVLHVRAVPTSFWNIDHNLLLLEKLHHLIDSIGVKGLIKDRKDKWFYHYGTPWAENWFNLRIGKNAIGKNRKIYTGKELYALAHKEFHASWLAFIKKHIDPARLAYLLSHPQMLYHENCYAGLSFPDELQDKNISPSEAVIASEKLESVLNGKMAMEMNNK